MRLVELAASEAVELDGYRIGAYSVAHSTEAVGYALVEDERPAGSIPRGRRELGVEPGPRFGQLQRGRRGGGRTRSVGPRRCMGEPRPGRKLVFTRRHASRARPRSRSRSGAELLVHDGTFADDEVERARQTGHSTAREAAEVAREADVALLALTHLSSRYFAPVIEKEAREVFERTVVPRDFDVIEVPYRGAGEPELVAMEGYGVRGTSPTSCNAAPTSGAAARLAPSVPLTGPARPGRGTQP